MAVAPNGKRYFGITTDFNRRVSEHRRKNCSKKLFNAIRKYGEGVRFLPLLFSNDYVLLKALEMLLIFHWDSVKRGLNITRGGDGTLGYRHTSDSRKAMSKAKSGKAAHNREPLTVRIDATGEVISFPSVAAAKRQLKTTDLAIRRQLGPRKAAKRVGFSVLEYNGVKICA